MLFLLLFVAAPLIELYFLIQVGSLIGALPTIGLSILTAVIGGMLVRLQGLSVLMRVRDMLEHNEMPALELLDGAILLICGFALLLPGFITDAVGFLLLIPPFRHLLIRRYAHVVPAPGANSASQHGRDHNELPHVIDGEFRREDD